MSIQLATFALHEIYAGWEGDAAMRGFVLGAASQGGLTRPLLWVRHGRVESEGGLPYPPGLAEFGLDPSRFILVRAREALSVLQAGLEGARTPGLTAVVIELWGEAKAYDLTASRRLALAAKASGVRVLMTRIAAKPQPSAAETRWLLRGLPSRALAARAPGAPAFELTLLRARNGQEGVSYRLEWNRDECCFAILHAGEGRLGNTERWSSTAPLSGRVASLPADRSAAAGALRRTG